MDFQRYFIKNEIGPDGQREICSDKGQIIVPEEWLYLGCFQSYGDALIKARNAYPRE